MASPQFARQLRTLMLLDDVYKKRDIELKEMDLELSKNKSPLPAVSQQWEKKLNEAYAFELSLISDYATNIHKTNYQKSLQEMELRRSQNRPIPKALQKRHDKMKMFAEMPPEQYAIAMMAMPAGQKRIRALYPELVKEQAKMIKDFSRHEKYQNISPYARHIYATIDVFLEKNPRITVDLVNQLESPVSDVVIKKMSISALHQLGRDVFVSPHHAKTGLEYDKNFNSQAIAAIISTPSISKLTNKITNAFQQIFNRPEFSNTVSNIKGYVKGINNKVAAAALCVGMLCIPSITMQFNDMNPSLNDQSAAKHVEMQYESNNIAYASDMLIQSPALTEDVGSPSQSLISEFIEESVPTESVFHVAVNHNVDPSAPNLDAPIEERIVLEPSSPEEDHILQRPTAEGGVYRVHDGDTLSEIIEAQLIDAETSYSGNEIRELYLSVAELNNIKDPDLIYPGQYIHLPSVEEDVIKFSPEMTSNEKVQEFKSEVPDDQELDKNLEMEPYQAPSLKR